MLLQTIIKKITFFNLKLDPSFIIWNKCNEIKHVDMVTTFQKLGVSFSSFFLNVFGSYFTPGYASVHTQYSNQATEK